MTEKTPNNVVPIRPIISNDDLIALKEAILSSYVELTCQIDKIETDGVNSNNIEPLIDSIDLLLEVAKVAKEYLTKGSLDDYGLTGDEISYD